jgi:hypothetical protein
MYSSNLDFGGQAQHFPFFASLILLKFMPYLHSKPVEVAR